MLVCPHFLLPLLLFPLFVIGTFAILHGETVEWAQNGFLAKILAKSRKKGDVRSCTGSLVSASLVLTSGHCVVDRRNRNETGKRKMTEFVVLLPALPPTNRSGENASQSEQWREGGDGQPPFRSTAKLLATGGRECDEAGGWALLRIVPRNASTTHCPPNRFSRLGIRPSSSDANGPSSQFVPLPADLADPGTECQMIGFSTSEKAEDFLTEEKVFRLHLNGMAEPPTDDPFHHYRSQVYKDGHTACYDDSGAPLFCKLSSSDKGHVQLGLFQSLTVSLDVLSKEMDKGKEQCRKAREMRFTLLTEDQKLAEAIQRYGKIDEGFHNCDKEK
ncbi:hypothetical protein niasHS_002154 [Heterodera schachtii]|uniref:Peptidase S1 domain-containing protein n=1 Tax=Heterodera schachtii TaxID=97005 RepID=A0ABD2KN24_HETSC